MWWPIHYPGHLPLDERGELSDDDRLEQSRPRPCSPAVTRHLFNNSNPPHGFDP